MSEISHHRDAKREALHSLFNIVLNRENAHESILNNPDLIKNTEAIDIIALVDQLVRENLPLEELKTGINKFLNLLGKTIKAMPEARYQADGLLAAFKQVNNQLDTQLKAIKPLIRQLNGDEGNAVKPLLMKALTDLQVFENYYTVKENVLFPLVEKHWSDYRCLGVMWSFHDDIRQNLRLSIEVLSAGNLDLKAFNRIIGDLFFAMYAIRLREEKLLYPLVESTIPQQELDALLAECVQMNLPFYDKAVQPDERFTLHDVNELVQLQTGVLSAEQILLMINHLPVDITFVDEFNKVKFFSTPKHRIFPRSKAIIGRDVHNCHPPESVHVVEEIVEAFRSGKKDSASFWIRIKDKMVLIQYFAMRESNGTYRGVIEVSQEISDIQALKGEKRLLDW